MQCVEQKLTSLDEDISRTLPEWQGPEVIEGFDLTSGKPILRKVEKEINSRRLLGHSSGMAYEIESPKLLKYLEFIGEDPAEIPKLLSSPNGRPLLFEPRKNGSIHQESKWLA
ncbi:MAG: hypothetical protein M1827_000114 [Pycnora praestabilis]|nr:MAG: hypothetical protein M1827_000114 [Pycnora praestabilis]